MMKKHVLGKKKKTGIFINYALRYSVLENSPKIGDDLLEIPSKHQRYAG